MEKECSPPSVSVSHTNPTTNTLEGCERFRFSLSPFSPRSGKSKSKISLHQCAKQNLAESPRSQPRLGRAAIPRWFGGVEATARPPCSPWCLRLDQADPRRPTRPGPEVVHAKRGQLRQAWLCHAREEASFPRMGKVIPGRIFDPLQGESHPGGRHPPPVLPSNQPPGCLRSCLLKFNLSLKHSIKNGEAVTVLVS